MTNFEFIRSKFPDFLVDSKIIKANLVAQEVPEDESFSKDADNMNLDMAYAACLEYILRLPASISQGSFSLSLSEKDFFKAELKAIYSKYNKSEELSLMVNRPDITNAGEWR